jgi:cytochrome c oxidase assembly protein subunit 11
MYAERSSNSNVAILCCAGILGMLVLAYAAVPLYDLFCRVTGYGGTTQRADVAPSTVVDRVVTVRFDANTGAGLNWNFAHEGGPMDVQVGESSLAFYRAENLSSEPLTGTAAFNVTPQKVGAYFSKIECFCFTEQTLAPGEAMSMPVSFFIDPAIMDEPDLDDVKTITLSYTFFPSEE